LPHEVLYLFPATQIVGASCHIFIGATDYLKSIL